MVSRSVRIALLTLAAWAIVFAPGAAGTGGSEPARASADDVAAAVVAPTFGPDGIVLARTLRDSTDDLADTVAVPFVLAAVIVIIGSAGLAEHLRRRCNVDVGQALRCSLPLRAPPVG